MNWIVSACLLCLALLASGQQGFFQKSGPGVIGFFQPDSVFYSPDASTDNLRPALNAVEYMPEMQGDFVYGPIVWQCLIDSAGWYKSRMHLYLVTGEGEITGDTVFTGYVKHSPFVEFQKWEKYLRGKYIFGFDKSVKLMDAVNTKVPLKCEQRKCFKIESVKGDWMKIVTPKESDCMSLPEVCTKEAAIQWVDDSGKLLIRLLP
jgi:hypothetical protein